MDVKREEMRASQFSSVSFDGKALTLIKIYKCFIANINHIVQYTHAVVFTVHRLEMYRNNTSYS